MEVQTSNQKIIELTTNLGAISNVINLLDDNTVLRKESNLLFRSYSNVNNYYITFYNNENSSTLIVDIYLQALNTTIPLSVQKGNVLNETDATSEYTFYHLYNGTFVPYTLKCAPVTFFQNITTTTTVKIPLKERGWYTLSILGPISLSDRFYGVREIFTANTLYVEASYQIEKNGSPMLFGERVKLQR